MDTCLALKPFLSYIPSSACYEILKGTLKFQRLCHKGDFRPCSGCKDLCFNLITYREYFLMVTFEHPRLMAAHCNFWVVYLWRIMVESAHSVYSCLTPMLFFGAVVEEMKQESSFLFAYFVVQTTSLEIKMLHLQWFWRQSWMPTVLNRLYGWLDTTWSHQSKGNLSWRVYEIGLWACLEGTVLVDDWWRRAQSTVGGTILRQKVLGYVRKSASWGWARKQGSRYFSSIASVWIPAMTHSVFFTQ